jgi:hypothetical protein
MGFEEAFEDSTREIAVRKGRASFVSHVFWTGNIWAGTEPLRTTGHDDVRGSFRNVLHSSPSQFLHAERWQRVGGDTGLDLFVGESDCLENTVCP